MITTINEYINENQSELDFAKQTYTREDVINLLEDVYCEVAGDYNDYGKQADFYGKQACIWVAEYMKDK